jgi:anaerobic magnesium-protoporphyrin IX monomethyl ester cyclase
MKQVPQADIVLTTPPYSLSENFGMLDFVGHYGVPLNLLYLATSLERAGIRATIVDLSYSSRTTEDCAREILASEPRFVGVAVHFSFLVRQALDLIAQIKRLDPLVTIIVGGVHFTALPTETMAACSLIDLGILGEAEEALVEVVRCVTEGRDPVTVAGIVFRDEARLVTTGRSNLVAEIDRLPFVHFDKIDMAPYSWAMSKERKHVNFSIITSRGCPHRCAFCDRTIPGRQVRLHSIDYLSRLIDQLVEQHGADCLNIEDENVCVSERRFRELCALLKDKHRRLGITWSCSMRADSVEACTGKMLHDAGCRSVCFGIESGSSKMLQTYNKKMRLGELPGKCRLLRAAGISLTGSFMIGGPGEDSETIAATRRLVRKLELDYLYLWYFVPHPGSEMYDRIESCGRLIGGYPAMTGQHICFIPNSTSARELEWGYRGIYRTFYTKPDVLRRLAKRVKPSHIPRFARNSLKYFYRFFLAPVIPARTVVNVGPSRSAAAPDDVRSPPFSAEDRPS